MSSSPQKEIIVEDGIIVVPQQVDLNNTNNTNQPVTEEERQWMIDDVKQKTKSLQELLINYRAMEDKLKEEVLECVLRDIHEQNIHIGINKRVQLAQQDLLNDTAYVGWAMKNGKGEFAASFGRAAPRSSPSGEQNEREQEKINNISWKDLIMIISSGKESVNPSNLPLSTLILPPRIALILGSFQQLDHEDSSVPETLKTRFASFLTLVEVWKQRVEAQFLGGKEPAVLLLNGIPLFGSLASIPSAPDKHKLLSNPSSSVSVEDNVSNLINEFLARSASSPKSVQDIFSMKSKLSKSFFHSLLKQGTNSEEMMATSSFPSHDTLSLVPLKKLQDSLLVYVLATTVESTEEAKKLQVVAIEPVVSSFALHVAKGFASINAIKAAVETFCQQVVSPFVSMKTEDSERINRIIPRRSILTIALNGSDALSSILVDVCELTPHLPTKSLSWGDACSILRQQNTSNTNNNNNSSSVGSDGISNSNVVFRGQKSKVANLQDAIENEKEDENNNNNNNDNSVGECFLQMIQETLDFDPASIQSTQELDSPGKVDGEIGGSTNYAKAAIFLAAGAAFVTGAFLALRKK